MESTPALSRRRFLTGDFRNTSEADRFTGDLRAAIGSGCLPLIGVDCQICRDVCPEEAIRFRLRRGGPSLPDVRPELCTGCGDCTPACPAAAIRLEPVPEASDA